ncbi:MAG: helix-turn-helix domain-containing protein [Dysgonomonas sp.]|nr:helix-turn-helix domain-containing protein [Dysgonomonas sp.]
MACAYLSLGVMNIVELMVQPEVMNIRSTKMIALLVCLFQAFLFTYTNITLININFPSKRKILSELIPIIILCISTPVFLTSNFLSEYIDILFYFFIIYYVSALIRYTILFHQNYRDYLKKIDNYFAEQESKRFRWISLSFYAALALGSMALIVTLFFSTIIGVIFSVLIIGFYSYYGIQFINYAFLFQNIESVIIDNQLIEKENEVNSSIRNYSLLEKNMEQWIMQKQFLTHGINIESVALQLNTNRTYLSEYVNTYIQKTFKEWINELRINEAKKLLLEHPDFSISEISEITGFSDKSNFGRVFTRHMGMPPNVWRISKISLNQQVS